MVESNSVLKARTLHLQLKSVETNASVLLLPPVLPPPPLAPLASVRPQHEEQQRLHREDRHRPVLFGPLRIQPLAADAQCPPHGRGAVAQPAVPGRV